MSIRSRALEAFKRMSRRVVVDDKGHAFLGALEAEGIALVDRGDLERLRNAEEFCRLRLARNEGDPLARPGSQEWTAWRDAYLRRRP